MNTETYLELKAFINLVKELSLLSPHSIAQINLALQVEVEQGNKVV